MYAAWRHITWDYTSYHIINLTISMQHGISWDHLYVTLQHVRQNKTLFMCTSERKINEQEAIYITIFDKK